jgi:hypothetical protein
MRKTNTFILAGAMEELSRSIQTDDGVAESAIYEASERLIEQADEIKRLLALLSECAIHVVASNGAEHMLDGFKPQKRPTDSLVKRLKTVLGE